MKREKAYEVRLQCASTVFHIYLHNENEASKLDIFLDNMNSVKNLALQDLYNWCNRQKVDYDTRFHYNRRISVLKNICFFIHYIHQKNKYLFRPHPGRVPCPTDYN